MELGMSTLTKLVHAGVMTAVIGVVAPVLAADLGGGSRGSIKDDPAPIVETEPRFYFGVRGGLAFLQGTDFGVSLAGSPNKVTSNYDAGYFAGGMLGMHLYRLTGVRGLRGDVEAGLHRSDVRRLTSATSVGEPFVFGGTDIAYGLASLYYDFPASGRLRPFIGAGAGIAAVRLKSHGADVPVLGTIIRLLLVDDSSVAFAYHVTAGLNFEISKSVTLEAAYRYLGTVGAELAANDAVRTRSDVDVHDHQVMMGLRVGF
jgi:opacity protein-like surface antigen